MKTEPVADIVLGSAVVALSLLLITVLIPIGVVVPSENNVLALSPDFWIKIVTWGLLLVGGYVLWQGIRGLRSDITATAEAEENYHPQPKRLALVATAIVALFLYYLSIKWLGMVIASIVFALFFMTLAGERRWAIVAGIALMLPVGLYYFFLLVTSIQMPLGIFG